MRRRVTSRSRDFCPPPEIGVELLLLRSVLGIRLFKKVQKIQYLSHILMAFWCSFVQDLLEFADLGAEAAVQRRLLRTAGGSELMTLTIY